MATRGEDSRATHRMKRMFGAHADRVHAFAAHRVGNDLARDVVSETFLVAWRRLDSVPDSALPWLLGTARKVIANELRGRARQLALTERLAAQTENVPPADGAAALRQDVLSALRALDPADQEILVLSAWYDLTGLEAARVLGCSPGTYAVRLHRARRRLGRELIDGQSPTTRSRSSRLMRRLHHENG